MTRNDQKKVELIRTQVQMISLLTLFFMKAYARDGNHDKEARNKP